MSDVLEGACYCGRITWQTTRPVAWSAFCHCESCRRNCAAPVAAFFGMRDGDWSWSGPVPERFVRDDVTRFFCGTCGTPVAYRAERFAGEIHFYMAALTQGTVAPTFHVHHAEAVDWMTITDDLKRYPGSANAGMEGDSA